MPPQPAVPRQGEPKPGSPVDLHIEELVLRGFDSGDRHKIARAVELELARLIGEQGLPRLRQDTPELERLKGGVFRVNAGAKPQAVGNEIAKAVFGSLRQYTRISAARRIPPPKGGKQP